MSCIAVCARNDEEERKGDSEVINIINKSHCEAETFCETETLREAEYFLGPAFGTAICTTDVIRFNYLTRCMQI